MISIIDTSHTDLAEGNHTDLAAWIRSISAAEDVSPVLLEIDDWPLPLTGADAAEDNGDYIGRPSWQVWDAIDGKTDTGLHTIERALADAEAIERVMAQHKRRRRIWIVRRAELAPRGASENIICETWVDILVDGYEVTVERADTDAVERVSVHATEVEAEAARDALRVGHEMWPAVQFAAIK